METLFLILLVLAAVCFAVAAFGRGKYDTRVSLVPLGLFLWVLVQVVQAFQAVD